MKTVFKVLSITILGLALLTSFAQADSEKGQKIIQMKISKACKKAGIEDGGALAKKHTQKEWKKIFDGGKLNEELAKLCPDVKKLKTKYASHAFDFLYYYANDSGNVPS